MYNFALGNKKEELYLNKNIKSSTSTLSKINTKSKYYNFKLSILNPIKKNVFLSKEKVKVEKIDDFFYQKKINAIDILKIDTEGFELNVIEGAINTLQKTRIIIKEFLSHDMYLNYDPKKIEDFLITNNFLLIKSIKYPLVKYEDRVYINKNIKNDY